MAKKNGLMTLCELCEYLKISRSTLWRLRQKKDFPKMIELSERKKLFKRKEIERYLRCNKKKKAS